MIPAVSTMTPSLCLSLITIKTLMTKIYSMNIDVVFKQWDI